MILFGLFFANGLRETGISWDAYSPAAFNEARENGMPVVIDFYADWCIPCLELDRNTWTDPEVMKATQDISRLKVDLTQFDSPESEAVRKQFEISGVPTVIFIRPDGTEAIDLRIIGFVPPKEFLEKLNHAMTRQDE